MKVIHFQLYLKCQTCCFFFLLKKVTWYIWHKRNQKHTHMIIRQRRVKKTSLFFVFFCFFLLPFERNHALDLVQKVTNEIWLKSSRTCHAPESSTETFSPNRTCCTLPHVPFYQLMPYMWLCVWFIPFCLTAPMISQHYGVWVSSSKCRRTSSQLEGWVLALRAGEAEIKDAWSSTHPPEDDQHGSIFSLKLWACVDVLHTPYRIIHASCKRKHRHSALARQLGLCFPEQLWGVHTCLFFNAKWSPSSLQT